MPLVHPDDLTLAMETFQHVLRREPTPPYELRILSKSGEYLTGEFTSFPHIEKRKMIGEFGIVRDITERKKAEKEIQDLAKFPSENPSPVLRIARDGLLLYVNKAGLRQLAELHLQVGQAAPPILREVVFQVMENGSAQELDLEHRERVYSFFVGPVVDAGYANLYGLDITERKRAEAELIEREMFNSALFEYNPSQTVVVDLEGKVIKFNLAKKKSGNRLPNIGDTMYKDYAGMHETDMYAELMKCIRSGEEKEFPEQKYGDRVLSITISPFPEGAVIISEDITERKLAEEALRESKDFVENLIASMLDGISVLDSDGVHIDVNATLCRMTGFSREELIGVGLPHPYWPPEAYEEIETSFQKTLRGDFSDVELAFMRKNGERFPVIVSPSWVQDKQGNVVSYFATVKDITERKRAEEEKRRLEERSRKIVEDIFRFIPEGVLVFSRKMELLRQNQAFRELVSGYAGRLGFAEDELENLIIDKIKAGLGDKNIKEIRISRKHETGK
jgi:PAS domain S-box-containing protein